MTRTYLTKVTGSASQDPYRSTISTASSQGLETSHQLLMYWWLTHRIYHPSALSNIHSSPPQVLWSSFAFCPLSVFKRGRVIYTNIHDYIRLTKECHVSSLPSVTGENKVGYYGSVGAFQSDRDRPLFQDVIRQLVSLVSVPFWSRLSTILERNRSYYLKSCLWPSLIYLLAFHRLSGRWLLGSTWILNQKMPSLFLSRCIFSAFNSDMGSLLINLHSMRMIYFEQVS